MPKNISFRIRRIYYDQIVEGTKTFELRPISDYWQKKIHGHKQDYVHGEAVFVCGKDVHRRRIEDIYIVKPEEKLGRSLSAQGKRDIFTDRAYCFELGEVVEKGGNP